jgi:predicted ATPase
MRKFIGITKIKVRDFTSIVDQSIEIKPITLLLGRNNSGKSNMMYPLVWLTSMLQENAPLVCSCFEEDNPIESWGQINPKIAGTHQNRFSIEVGYGHGDEFRSVNLLFCKPKNEEYGNVQLERILYVYDGCVESPIGTFPAKQKQDQVLSFHLSSIPEELLSDIRHLNWAAAGGRNFCNLRQYRDSDPCKSWCGFLSENFATTTVECWQKSNDIRLSLLVRYLQEMGLCDDLQIWANPDDEAKEDDEYKTVELRALFYQNAFFNHSDTPGVPLRYAGDGLTQIFSVLVSLIAAEPNQVVYLEHPEMALHPSAYRVLVEAIVDSMKRDVRVVIETHSGLILSLLQLSAVRNSFCNDVALHWFSRDKDGQTEIIHGGFDEFGSFGDIPIDLKKSSERLLYEYSKPFRKN